MKRVVRTILPLVLCFALLFTPASAITQQNFMDGQASGWGLSVNSSSGAFTLSRPTAFSSSWFYYVLYGLGAISQRIATINTSVSSIKSNSDSIKTAVLDIDTQANSVVTFSMQNNTLLSGIKTGTDNLSLISTRINETNNRLGAIGGTSPGTVNSYLSKIYSDFAHQADFNTWVTQIKQNQVGINNSVLSLSSGLDDIYNLNFSSIKFLSGSSDPSVSLMSYVSSNNVSSSPWSDSWYYSIQRSISQSSSYLLTLKSLFTSSMSWYSFNNGSPSTFRQVLGSIAAAVSGSPVDQEIKQSSEDPKSSAKSVFASLITGGSTSAVGGVLDDVTAFSDNVSNFDLSSAQDGWSFWSQEVKDSLDTSASSSPARARSVSSNVGASSNPAYDGSGWFDSSSYSDNVDNISEVVEVG